MLHDWMKPAEVTASDIPWAVAWYANRRSVWLPDTPKALVEFRDNNVLGAPINGLYLTPVSSTDINFRDIVKGEYHDWAAVIMRLGAPNNFPFKWQTFALGVENECVFFSDHDREHTSPPP